MKIFERKEKDYRDPKALCGKFGLRYWVTLSSREVSLASIGQSQASVHKEDWQLGSSKNMLSCATENHLPETALGVGALDQQIRALGFGSCENNRTRPLSTIANGFLCSRNAMRLKVVYRLSGGRTRDHIAFNTQHDNPLGFA